MVPHSFYNCARLEQIASLTESIRHINPLPAASASINKQIILYVLCDIKLADEMEEFLQFRRNQLNQISSKFIPEMKIFVNYAESQGVFDSDDFKSLFVIVHILAKK